MVNIQDLIVRCTNAWGVMRMIWMWHARKSGSAKPIRCRVPLVPAPWAACCVQLYLPPLPGTVLKASAAGRLVICASEGLPAAAAQHRPEGLHHLEPARGVHVGGRGHHKRSEAQLRIGASG